MSKNRLIIIQFLSESEPQTGLVLANNAHQFAERIDTIDLYMPKSANELCELMTTNIPKGICKTDNVGIYLDSHGLETCGGIGNGTDFIDWATLIQLIKRAMAILNNSPSLYLTACNGLSIRDHILSEKTPISVLYAGDGIMKNGPVMWAFCQLFSEEGLCPSEKRIQEINTYLKSRDCPPLQKIDFTKGINKTPPVAAEILSK